MVLGSITNPAITLPPLPILCAAAAVFLSWIIATFAPTQLRKLQSATKSTSPRHSVDHHQNNKKGSRITNHVYEIAELRVYPVKSCRGISIRKTNMHMQGLWLDRQWVFVDAKTHKCVTIRQFPKMTLINTQISEDGQNLILTAADVQVSLSTRPSQEWLNANTTLVDDVVIWDDTTDGYMYGPEVNDVFSRFLGSEVRLVYKGPGHRILRGNGAPALLGRVQTTLFADGFPVLVASEASIAELNFRLTAKGEQAITIERFRPNIIVRGSKPWAEDSWLIAKVYDKTAPNDDNAITIDVVSRCTRCAVPRVEPDTAIQHKKEPSTTLGSYRRIDPGSPYGAIFGMNAVPRSEGLIEVGMKFAVVMETDQHRIIKD